MTSLNAFGQAFAAANIHSGDDIAHATGTASTPAKAASVRSDRRRPMALARASALLSRTPEKTVVEESTTYDLGVLRIAVPLWANAVAQANSRDGVSYAFKRYGLETFVHGITSAVLGTTISAHAVLTVTRKPDGTETALLDFDSCEEEAQLGFQVAPLGHTARPKPIRVIQLPDRMQQLLLVGSPEMVTYDFRDKPMGGKRKKRN